MMIEIIIHLLMINSTSLTFRNKFNDVFFIRDAMCLIAASLTVDSTFYVDNFQLFTRKMILVDLQLILHSQ